MVRRSTAKDYKRRYINTSSRSGDTLYKVSNRKVGDPYKKRKTAAKPRKSVRSPVRRKVAGRKPRCRVHKVCIQMIRTGKKTRKISAVMNCKGKIRLTKTGRKSFNAAKKTCRCKKNAGLGGKPVGRSCAVRRRKTRR